MVPGRFDRDYSQFLTSVRIPVRSSSRRSRLRRRAFTRTTTHRRLRIHRTSPQARCCSTSRTRSRARSMVPWRRGRGPAIRVGCGVPSITSSRSWRICERRAANRSPAPPGRLPLASGREHGGNRGTPAARSATPFVLQVGDGLAEYLPNPDVGSGSCGSDGSDGSDVAPAGPAQVGPGGGVHGRRRRRGLVLPSWIVATHSAGSARSCSVPALERSSALGISSGEPRGHRGCGSACHGRAECRQERTDHSYRRSTSRHRMSPSRSRPPRSRAPARARSTC